MTLKIVFFSVMTLFTATSVDALPIGYGYNQGPLEFSEVRDQNFKVYFDARVPDDARTALNSLNAAKPALFCKFCNGFD